MGSGKLSGKPDAMLGGGGVALQWISIPSWGRSDTSSLFCNRNLDKLWLVGPLGLEQT